MLEEASCILRLPIENHITCKICGKEFTSKKCFWRHRKYHKEGQKCQCPICLQWFISQTLLNVHMQNHQDQKTFDWQVGGKTLASKQSFVFHQETHVRVTSNIFKCSLCPKDFPDERRLTVHKHTHSRNRERCALCTMNYPNKASLKKHKDAKHRKITFLCEICNVKFSSKGSLKSHQKTHREERAFICELCNAQFNFSNSLKVHKNKNHGGLAGSNIHTCSICTKEFHSPGGLQRHEKAIHQADIIFVKRFTRPQFWASKIYAKKTEFAIKQVRDKIM